MGLIPIWWFDYLPMHDFPQHAAQISIVANINNPLYGFTGHYWFNWTTPYLVGILTTALMAKIVGVEIAIKIALSLIFLGLTLSLKFLLKQTDGDPWWSLMGFPLFFGFNLLVGHFNFLVSIPFGIIFLALVIKFDNGIHSVRSYLVLLGSAFFLLLCHAAAYIFISATTSIYLVIKTNFRNKREIVTRILLVSVLLCWPFIWLKITQPHNAFFRWPHHAWSFDWEKLRWLPNFVVSIPGDKKGHYASILMLLAIILGAKINRSSIRPTLLILFAGVISLVPSRLIVHTLFERLTILFLPFFFCIFQATPSLHRKIISRTILALSIVWWLHIVTHRLAAFNAEAQTFNVIVDAAEYNKRILPLIFSRNSRFFNGDKFIYFGSWLQAKRGGHILFTYATHPPNLARLKTSSYILNRSRSLYIQFVPHSVRKAEAEKFDYILVRSTHDRQHFFDRKSIPVELIATQPPWWLYKVLRSSHHEE